MVECLLIAQWVLGSIHFLFQSVYHNWINKGHGMCYPVYGMHDVAYQLEKSHSCSLITVIT